MAMFMSERQGEGEVRDGLYAQQTTILRNDLKFLGIQLIFSFNKYALNVYYVPGMM